MIKTILAMLTCACAYAQQPASIGQIQSIVSGAKQMLTPTLIKLPISEARDTITNVGATAVYQNALAYNSDGTGKGINIVVPTTTPPSDYVRISVLFQGSTFGVRWVEQNSTPFTVDIDGKTPTRVINPDQFRVLDGDTGQYQYEVQAITHQGLPAGNHVAHIWFASGQQAVLLGFLQDKVAEPVAPGLRSAFPGQIVVVGSGPSTAKGLTGAAYASTIGTSAVFSWVSQVVYSNWTASPITLYQQNSALSVSGATAATPCILTVSSTSAIPDGCPCWPSSVGGMTIGGGSGGPTSPIYLHVLTSSTIALYSDPALTIGVASTGTYTASGTVSVLSNLYQIPANGSLTLTFSPPLFGGLWTQYASAAGLTCLPWGGYNQ